jgi:hypothetical protein
MAENEKVTNLTRLEGIHGGIAVDGGAVSHFLLLTYGAMARWAREQCPWRVVEGWMFRKTRDVDRTRERRGGVPEEKNG